MHLRKKGEKRSAFSRLIEAITSIVMTRKSTTRMLKNDLFSLLESLGCEKK
jgi:hypothetical protein